MADDPKDDGNMGGGDPAASHVKPGKKRVGEEPGPKNTTFGGGQQKKAAKNQNFTGGSGKQDTHK